MAAPSGTGIGESHLSRLEDSTQSQRRAEAVLVYQVQRVSNTPYPAGQIFRLVSTSTSTEGVADGSAAPVVAEARSFTCRPGSRSSLAASAMSWSTPRSAKGSRTACSEGRGS
jgi:hypothetical protein